MASPSSPAKQASHQPWASRLRPRPSTLLLALIACRYARPSSNTALLGRLAHLLALLLSIANWRIVPFYWHINTLWPILVVKLKRWRLGTNERYIEHLGLIGRSPFDARITSKHCASLHTCDFMLHMSNSAYAVALDEARCIWHLNMIGVTMRSDQEQVRSLVASTHYTYFVEIPVLADFEVDVWPVSWDHKWVYLLAVFTTAPPKGSRVRTVNCLSITRVVLKIGRRTVPPAKLFAIGGLGKDDSNWKSITALRAQPRDRTKKLNPAQEWLLNGEMPADLLSEYEDKRIFNLEIVRSALDGTSGAERLKELL